MLDARTGREDTAILRRRFLLISLSVFAVLSNQSFAGEDFPLLDSEGNVLAPSQRDEASVVRTCGGCHEIDDLAASAHFNRGEKDVDPEYSDCLTCHVPEGAGAFNPGGNVIKTPREPQDSACTSCHSEMEAWSAKKAGTAHERMSCYECHKDSGHQTAGAASCSGCHTREGGAANPRHWGFPALHMRRVACESCHIRRTPFEPGEPGFVMKNGVVVAVSEGDQTVHHNVAKASQAWGASGCGDCHSSGSEFFFGKTNTGETDDADRAIFKANYESMGLTKRWVLIGGLREQIVKPVSGWLFVLMIVVSAAHYVVFGPRRARSLPGEPEVQRFTPIERIAHVLALVTFAFLAVTGMMFLFHLESPTGLARHVHGVVGAAFVIALVLMIANWWRGALFVSCDKDWVCNLGGYLWRRGECPAEKFNAGQKIFFWSIVVGFGTVASVTGIMLLVSRGSSPSWVFTLHDLAALALIAGIIGHAYLSILANPGTIRSMLTGRVTRSWAEHHHPNWLMRQDVLGSRDRPPPDETET